MIRLLRTLAYWLRALLRPSSVTWTWADDIAYEVAYWREGEEA